MLDEPIEVMKWLGYVLEIGFFCDDEVRVQEIGATCLKLAMGKGPGDWCKLLGVEAPVKGPSD